MLTWSILPLLLLSTIVIEVRAGAAASVGAVSPKETAWLPAASRAAVEPAVYASVKLPTLVSAAFGPSVMARVRMFWFAPVPRVTPERVPPLGTFFRFHGVFPAV